MKYRFFAFGILLSFSLFACSENGISENKTSNLQAIQKESPSLKTNGEQLTQASPHESTGQISEQADPAILVLRGLRYIGITAETSDYPKALYWFRKAAAQNQPVAEYQLGRCYENGLGVAKDLNQAVVWYRKSAEQEGEGGLFARQHLRMLVDQGKIIPSPDDQMGPWWRS